MPFALTQLRVSANDELLRVLAEIWGVQAHVQQPIPLLVDEKIRYAVCRFLYSRSYVARDIHSWI